MTLGRTGLLPRAVKGEIITAEFFNQAMDELEAGVVETGPYVSTDGTGTHLTRQEPCYQVWKIELKEDLAQWATVPVLACVKELDGTANEGWGGYVINLVRQIYVADWRKVGYWGFAGAEGAVEVNFVKNGMIGVLCDLECPEVCVCGEVDPNASVDCVD